MVERARKVITRRTKRVLYKFPSLRMRRTIYCESGLEFDYAYLLEFDHGDVERYREQPIKLAFTLEGSRHVYTSDFMVTRRGGGVEIVEVKPTARALLPESRRAFAAIHEVCAAKGWTFLVADGDQIRLQPRLRNVKRLWKYSRTPVLPTYQIACREVFSAVPAVPLGRALELLRARVEQAGRLLAHLLGRPLRRPHG